MFSGVVEDDTGVQAPVLFEPTTDRKAYAKKRRVQDHLKEQLRIAAGKTSSSTTREAQLRQGLAALPASDNLSITASFAPVLVNLGPLPPIAPGEKLKARTRSARKKRLREHLQREELQRREASAVEPPAENTPMETTPMEEAPAERPESGIMPESVGSQEHPLPVEVAVLTAQQDIAGTVNEVRTVSFAAADPQPSTSQGPGNESIFSRLGPQIKSTHCEDYSSDDDLGKYSPASPPPEEEVASHHPRPILRSPRRSIASRLSEDKPSTSSV